jgi:L1 cell adhesion molecule like protein
MKTLAVARLQVIFDIDANGVMNVSAEDLDTGRKKSVTIINHGGRMPKEEIASLVPIEI